MSALLSRSPQAGDWVRAERTFAVTFTDHLLGGDNGIRRGSKGVVVERTGRRIVVDWDAGWGTQRATVSAWDCRVVRRGGGVESFHRQNRHLIVVRMGFALVLLWPVLQFVGEYVWVEKSFHGLTAAFALGAAQSLLDTVTGLLLHPIRSVIYYALIGVMSRVAFGRRR